MRKTAIFLGLMTFALSGMAQVIGPGLFPDMNFSINFSALSNSPPPASELSGSAYYYQIVPTGSSSPPSHTNQLSLVIVLPELAEAGWVLELEENGSLTRVAELTNPDNPAFFEQKLTLTTNQIYSMIAGNLYVEVDFADGSYLGNLTPRYASANGPTARMIFPPLHAGQPLTTAYTVISPNNRTAKFVFDGSNCTDPFYLPMQLSWVGYADDFEDPSAIVFTDTNVMATNVFKIGTHMMTLQASDIITTGQPFYFYLRVVTASEAINSFITILQTSPMPDNTKRALTKALSKAANHFNNGRMAAGRADLEFYKHLVRQSRFTGEMKYNLLWPVQEVVDAVQKQKN